MTQPVDVDLNLGGDYTQGVQQATQATEGLAVALNTLQAPSRSVQAALNAATPTKLHIAAWGGFVAAAGYFQSQVSGIRATASAAGQSMRVLSADVQGLARQFPVGTSGAVALVQAVQGLGAQQQRIRPLAQEFERLSAATNSFGPKMAEGFGQLNRSMASLDPNRIARFGDVLTTVSAKSGASAMGMISFSRSIAPVAQQAGIGESAVLGISSAFVKLGDDGGAAATAVNKILADLNRSVREGSNEMAGYAQVTGMTVQQFKALYQANPAQALSSVTNAIGRSGTRGQAMLEDLGFGDSIRTQRALLQLSQSGGLGAAVNQAVGAYGNGSTQKAAQEALSGLNSSLTELRSTAGQTADALGGPFLHVLTQLTNVAKVPLGALNSVLGSGIGQHAIGGFGMLALGGLAARRVVRPLGTLGLAAQMATSGPIRSLTGGYMLGRSEGDASRLFDAEGNPIGRMTRFGAQPLANQMMGAPYGRGFMQPINAGFMRAGNILGQFRTDLAGTPFVPGQGGPGGGLRRALGAGVTASSMAYEGWMRTFADPLHQATTDAGDRQSLLSPGMGGLFARAGQARQQAGLRAALGVIEREGSGAGKALGRMTSATVKAGDALFTFGGKVGGAGLAAGSSVLGGIGRSALGLVGGGLGAAVLGGTLAYSVYRGEQNQRSQGEQHIGSLDMFSTLNAYRDAMGQAGQATVTLADQMQVAAATIAKSVTSFPQARTVSAQDIAANPPNAKKVQHRYVGSNAAIAGQISAENLNGLSPQDLEAVKQDLLRAGRRPEDVNAILGAVNVNPGGLATTSSIQGIVAGAASAAGSHSQSFLHRIRGAHLSGEASTWQKIGGSVTPEIGSNATNTLDLLQGAIMQQYSNLAGNYTQAYAVQSNIRTANVALQQALKSGNPDLVASTAQRVGASLTGNQKFHVSAAAVQASGGDITKLLGNQKVYGQTMAQWGAQGVSSTGRGVAATRISSGDYVALQSAGASALMPYFAAQRPGGRAGGVFDAVAASQAQEANVGLQTTAVNSIVDAATKAGVSLTDLADQASKATSTTVGWEQALSQSIALEAQFRQQVRLQGAGRGAIIGASVTSDMHAIAAGPGVDPNGFQAQQYKQARQDLATQRGAIIDYYQQRVMAQYQYQIQVQRAQEDFQRQSSRSEEDYLIGRQRAYRDFNIQIQREAQDAAQQMYNPYQRIQVRPVWDAGNLAGNRAEQIGAMRRQIRDIKQLKRLGMSQAAIDQLQLYDPNNAQQADELVAELSADRSQISTLNQQASTMQSLAGQLVSQSPEYRRQRNDFQRNLRDQQSDFDRQQRRARQDFSTALTRMAQDLHTQDLQLTNGMTSLTKDMNNILRGQAVNLKDQITSNLADTLKAVHDYGPQINAGLNGQNYLAGQGSGGVVSGKGYAGPGGGRFWTGTPGADSAGTSFSRQGGGGVNAGFLLSGASTPGTDMKRYGNPDLNWGKDVAVAPDNRRLAPNAKLAQQMAQGYGWGSGPEWAALFQIWQQESGFSTTAGSVNKAYGIPQADPGSKMASYGRDWRTNPKTQIAWGLDYIGGKYGDPLGAWAHKARTGWYGAGGLFGGPSIIGVGERGPESVIPLNAQGLEFMVAALRQYVGPADAKLIGSGGLAHATHVYYTNDTYHYDQGQHIHGPVTVQANTPAEWAAQARAQVRRENLTAPRSVRWTKTGVS